MLINDKFHNTYISFLTNHSLLFNFLNYNSSSVYVLYVEGSVCVCMYAQSVHRECNGDPDCQTDRQEDGRSHWPMPTWLAWTGADYTHRHTDREIDSSAPWTATSSGCSLLNLTEYSPCNSIYESYTLLRVLSHVKLILKQYIQVLIGNRKM